MELSITDGEYYHNLPVGHESQGGFPFGSICAEKVAKDGSLSTVYEYTITHADDPGSNENGSGNIVDLERPIPGSVLKMVKQDGFVSMTVTLDLVEYKIKRRES